MNLGTIQPPNRWGFAGFTPSRVDAFLAGDEAALDAALADKARAGRAGGVAGRTLATGEGWRAMDYVCTCGPRDRAFEEREQRRAEDDGLRQRHRRNLVAGGLAEAGRQHDEDVATPGGLGDDALLLGVETTEAEPSRGGGVAEDSAGREMAEQGRPAIPGGARAA